MTVGDYINMILAVAMVLMCVTAVIAYVLWGAQGLYHAIKRRMK